MAAPGLRVTSGTFAGLLSSTRTMWECLQEQLTALGWCNHREDTGHCQPLLSVEAIFSDPPGCYSSWTEHFSHLSSRWVLQATGHFWGKESDFSVFREVSMLSELNNHHLKDLGTCWGCRSVSDWISWILQCLRINIQWKRFISL